MGYGGSACPRVPVARACITLSEEPSCAWRRQSGEFPGTGKRRVEVERWKRGHQQGEHVYTRKADARFPVRKRHGIDARWPLNGGSMPVWDS